MGSKGRREERVEKGGSVGLREGEGGSNPSEGRKLILQDGDMQVLTKTERCALLYSTNDPLLSMSSKGCFCYVAAASCFAVPVQSSCGAHPMCR